MRYDRGDSFPFDFEPNGISFGLKSKGKLSPRSYRIQCERKRKYSFLSVTNKNFSPSFQVRPFSGRQETSPVHAKRGGESSRHGGPTAAFEHHKAHGEQEELLCVAVTPEPQHYKVIRRQERLLCAAMKPSPIGI